MSDDEIYEAVLAKHRDKAAFRLFRRQGELNGWSKMRIATTIADFMTMQAEERQKRLVDIARYGIPNIVIPNECPECGKTIHVQLPRQLATSDQKASYQHGR